MVPQNAKSTRPKRRKSEEKNSPTPAKRPKKEERDSPKPKRPRCRHCKKLEDDVKMVINPQELFEDRPTCENVLDLLTDSKLKIVIDGFEDINENQNEEHDVEIRIKRFSFYHKKCGHLIPLETLDNGVETAFICGYAVKLTDDDKEIDKDSLPIVKIEVGFPWMFSPSDAGDKNVFGVSSSTESLHFYLGEPSESYKETFSSYEERSYLVKAVQNILTENPDLDFNLFLEELNDFAVPEDVGGILTEDTLLKNANYVLLHCKSLDANKDDDEVTLCETTVVRELQKRTGLKPEKIKKDAGRRRREPRSEKTTLNVKATTTPIIRQIFEGSLFDGTIHSEQNGTKLSSTRTKKTCGKCPNCVAPDCGKCSHCKDMKKFGGSGKSKQRCIERNCSNLAEIDSCSDLEDQPKRTKNGNISKAVDWYDSAIYSYDDVNTYARVVNSLSKCKVKGLAVAKVGGKNIFHSVNVGRAVLKVGDFVTVRYRREDQKDDLFEGCLRYFTQRDEKNITAHISWAQHANESLLGMIAEEKEYFFNGQCADIDVGKLRQNKRLNYFGVQEEWNLLGGTTDADILPETSFVKQWYDDSTYRFYYPKVLKDASDPAFCPDCRCRVPDLDVPTLDDVSDEGSAILTTLKRRGIQFSIDDDVLLKPDAFTFDYKLPKAKQARLSSVKENYDPLYPEKRRKNGYIKGSNVKAAVPYKVGRITKIFVSAEDLESINNGETITSDHITFVVRKFYRPENVGKTLRSDKYGSRKLFWSDEVAEVPLSQVHGKCLVLNELDYNPVTTLDSYLEGGSKRFFFEEAFNAKDNTFDVVGRSTQKLNVNVGKKSFLEQNKPTQIIPDPHPTIGRPLRSMDLFAGCGGLTRGFHDAGVADTEWAVEFDSHAAKAFKKNFPKATVYETDCNILLDALIQGKDKLDGQPLPKKGEVEFICGGPPCQGFSGMNRFTKSEYTKFRNSLVVTFFGFVDVLRPKFVVMENVRAFVSYKQSMVLKLTLRTLQRLGYQCTFGVLQAGSYGVPQTRRRAFLIAAAPGEILPVFPEPTHCFADRGLSLSVNIRNRKYEMPESFTNGSAPFATVTVEQACSDLPAIRIGNESEFVMNYKCDSLSYYQKLVRKNSFKLHDHITRWLNPIIVARIERIPTTPGSDWRDLCNEACQQKYKDKQGVEHTLYIDKLNYKFGKQDKNGNQFGVCTCNEGKPCDYRNTKQENTLIPWCLPHTADRHNHWAGLYGRVEWDGFFSTAVTNPEPMGKQGRVLHPIENRIISVREHARAQGFPDCHLFSGDVLRKYRQVGNAVPPPLAHALGLEIKACMAVNETETF